LRSFLADSGTGTHLPEIAREQARMLLRDERGPVSIAAADRKYGHALIGGQGGGKSSVLAMHFANDAPDNDRPVVLIDPKGPLAELCLGLVPAGRTVHYLDLGHPEIGINPLTIKASPGARAAVFLHALIEANPPGAIQAASDSFLRQAVAAVCAVERTPTLWHVYRLLESGHSPYRERVTRRLARIPGNDFARHYWRREFPALLGDRGFAAGALNPPRNKLERLISTREIDTLLRHPITTELIARAGTPCPQR
jgi:pimeloyl-ACP methyl ester carboxylesterase